MRDIEKALIHPDMRLESDKGDERRSYTIKSVLAHLKSNNLLYPDIVTAAKKDYVAVVNAILTHYPPEDKRPKSYDGLMKKGSEYHSNGNYDMALDFYRDAEKHIDGDRAKEMELYEKSADANLKKGEYARALGFYQQALDICVFMNGDDSFKTAKLYECMGFVLRKDRQYDEAKICFEKAKKTLSQKLEGNPNDPDVAGLYNNFGLMYLNEKDFENAHLNYKKAYLIREQNYEKYADKNEAFYLLDFAYSVHNMGTYYNKLVTDRIKICSEHEKTDCLKKAVEYHEKAYKMRLALLNGSDVLKVASKNGPLAGVCLEIAQSLTLWASDLIELDELDTALEKCKQGLAIREAKHGRGAEMQDIAWSFYTLGIICDKQGDFESSLAYFSESYRIRLKVCNGDHPYAAKALYQMGRMKKRLARPDAILDAKKALEIQKRSLKPDDPELFDTSELIKSLEEQH